MSLKLRRGTEAERSTITPELGELIYTIDSKQLYAGDGITQGGNLVSYNGSVGGNMGDNLVLNGNNITGQGNINISQGTIFAQGNITTGGNLIAQGNVIAQGDVIAQGNIVLGVGDDGDTIEFGGVVKSNIIPETNNFYDLGNETLYWNKVFSNSFYGNLIGTVLAEDSSILIDSKNSLIRGTLEGNLVGFVQGNVTGNVIGDITGSVRSANGEIVLDSGTDGTDAIFTGFVEGTVKDGVTTTGLYSNPDWIVSLDAEKITGTLRGNIINAEVIGDVRGSVFSDDSTLLVDGVRGRLIGLHVGELEGSVYTGSISIRDNIIAGDTDQNIFIATQNDGRLIVPGISEFGKINVTSDPLTGGISISSGSASHQPFLIFGAYAGGASSTGTGAATIYARARGTPELPTPLAINDEISTIVFSALTGFDLSGPVPAPVFSDTVNIVVSVDGAVSTGVAPGKLEINIANSAGTPTKRFGIDSAGVVEVAQDATLVAGGGAGQVNTGTIAAFIKVKIGNTEYAVPAYAINP